MPPRSIWRAVVLALVAAAVLPSAALAARNSPRIASVEYDGVQHLEYKFGPIKIAPGQNTIELAGNDLRPNVPGYITRFEPDLVYAKTGKIPRVDVIHLHHGVWAISRDGGFPYPTFAAGEEKTILQAPRGYGIEHKVEDKWIMNYMIHNLTPNEDSVYITYKMDFVPMDAPAAQAITPVKVLWMDVAGITLYPVFDVKRGRGKGGVYRFPEDASAKERRKLGAAWEHTFDRDVTLVGTAGHLHPGGLYTDMYADRGDQKDKLLFRSEAEYWEPAGAVSWDVGMTATKADWRPTLKAGDRLHISAAYDSRRASWYESMGIMVLFYAEGHRPEGRDPFTDGVDAKGQVTHGHLAENDNHGGRKVLGLPDARTMLDGSASASTILIKDFFYGRGDLNQGSRPPVVRQGRSLTFSNAPDDKKTIWHTITACKAPCNKDTGIAYPLADGPVDFDSAELGTDPTRPGTAASGKLTWKTPKTLRPGTYTYFCRIHPFMRGAFRVVGRNGKGSVTRTGRRTARRG